jgi:peptidoglycan/LPS O-acetylase OafA/YrhL
MLLVLAYHARLPHTKGAILALSQFFTMSGFLITSMLLRSDDRDRIDLRGFWSARFRRLLPASLVALVGVVLFGATVATAQQLENLPGQVASAATYTANWYFIATDQSYVDLFAAPSPVQHYWSLAIEEQFYLVLPLVMVALLPRVRSTRGRAIAIGGGAAGSLLWTAWLSRSGVSFDRLYYGTDTRMGEMLIGAVLAVLLHRVGSSLIAHHARLLAWAGAIAYIGFLWAVTSVSLDTPWLWQGGTALCAIASSVAIVGILTDQGPLRILRLGVLRGVGKISYGVYLYHWPIFLWLDAERTGLSTWPLFAVRCGVTFAVALASYHLIERPIRDGRLSEIFAPRLQAGLSVACVAALIGATMVVSRTDAPDPFETLRADDQTLTPPIAPEDGTLDILAISDEVNLPVVQRLDELTTQDPSVELVVAPTLSCSSLTGEPGARTCSEWAQQWPELIADHDPDVVVLLADGWPAGSAVDLAALPPTEVVDLTAEVLSTGMDALGERGATTLWASSGSSFEEALFRSTQPLPQAMTKLESERDDLRHMPGTRLPDPATVTAEEYLDQAAAAVLADASLYQRADRDRLPRILVVGDSQARSLGFGLERWTAANDRAVVWNVATEGCGLLLDGTVDGFGGSGPIDDQCRESRASWKSRVEAFDPDVTIVLTSVWDLGERTLAGWDEPATIGDPRFDAYAGGEFDQIVDELTQGGGTVIWLTAPCLSFEFGSTDEVPAEFGPERLEPFNERLVLPLEARHPDKVRVFDLDEALCPDGRYVDEVPGVDDLRVDGIHFSVEGAAWFAETYGDRLLGLWDL